MSSSLPPVAAPTPPPSTPTAGSKTALTVLFVVQILGSLGALTSLSVGALITARIGGDGWSGMAATLTTVGAAVWAIPLTWLVNKAGRAVAMSAGWVIATLGAVLAIAAAHFMSLPLIFVAFICLGAAAAVNLQARFAAAEADEPRHAGRNISLIVWATTIGAVVGPNLIGPGQHLSEALTLPPLTGAYVIAMAAQLIAIAVVLLALRIPRTLEAAATRADGDADRAAKAGIVLLAAAQCAMVAIMAMTPVHLTHEGGSLSFIGLTISLHVAGMYALSPVFGMGTERFGARAVMMACIVLYVAAVALLVVAPGNHHAIIVALVLVGLAWSAAMVSCSTLVARGSRSLQGRSDMVMNIAGAAGGALSGPLLVAIGMPGLALMTLGVVVATGVWSLAKLRR